MYNELIGTRFYCGDSSFCVFPTGDSVLEALEMVGPLSNIWIDMAFMMAIAISCHFLSLLLLTFLVKPKRG